MKKIIYPIFLLFISPFLFGQNEIISVKLIDQETGKAISGASIFCQNQYLVSDEQGNFSFNREESLPVKFVITHIGYEPYEGNAELEVGSNLTIPLKTSIRLLEEVLISSDDRPLVSQARIDNERVNRDNPKNVGDVFSNLAGFGIIKRGGYAMDPVFRSFKYEQLNFIYDGGVYISPACPNRMDPASTQISTAEIDRIELVKGPYSVRYGSTMGALINVITSRPTPVEQLTFSGELEGGYEVNGNGITGRGSIDVVDKNYDLSLQAGAISFDDYKNGNNELVPSSFSTFNYAAKLGINLAANQRLQMSWRQSFGRDIKHASLPMDSPEDNSSIFSLDYGVRNITDKIATFDAKAYFTYVDHLMSNENRPNSKMVDARSPVNSKTYGGRFELGLNTSQYSSLFVGLDLRTVAKDGVRHRTVKIMNGNPLDPPKEFTDLIWQDSWMYDVGTFAEANFTINNRTDLLLGGRIDFVKSGIEDPAPDFENLYGEISPQTEINFGITASVNYNYGQNGLIQLSIGRGQRAAELTERYINHFSVGMDAYEYVGNPYLKSEINNQVDFTINNSRHQFFWRANIFYAFMQNYISAIVNEDIPRKYMPGTEPAYTKQFVNIDQSWQMGFDAEIGYNISKELSTTLGAFYTQAENIDFGEPLPQITPLTGLVAVKFKKETYWTEVSGRFVADQNRVSASFDESKTPGFNVFDLMAGYSPTSTILVSFALKNIFDANYFEHLSRPYKNQSETGMFYEPGRSFRVGLKVQF